MTAQNAATALPLADVLPISAGISAAGNLALGGCDTQELLRRFGSPLYVFDEATLRHQCRLYTHDFRAEYPDTNVRYAAKAYLSRALVALLIEEGIGLDVCSGGEIAIARSAGFDPAQMNFHGNNKSEDELREAVTLGVGRVMVDNFLELDRLDHIAGQSGRRQPVLLRLSPGVDPPTHSHIATGQLDSKFGFAIETGDAAAAVARALALPNIDLRGYHNHLGSQLFELEPYAQAFDVIMRFTAAMRDQHGFVPSEYSPGGGFAVQYLAEAAPPPPEAFARTIATALREACSRYNLPAPRIDIEPGRSLVARAGVALYTAGGRKEIPGVRTYISIDGGMSDNMRPITYGARYEAIVATKPLAPNTETISIAGKFCESGDILIRDIALPRVDPGDIIAVPTCGAYSITMSSNYNAFLRPAIVLVNDGQARLIRRRETYDDLLATDVYDG
jgi:diaminopimelate decarboxylase